MSESCASKNIREIEQISKIHHKTIVNHLLLASLVARPLASNLACYARRLTRSVSARDGASASFVGGCSSTDSILRLKEGKIALESEMNNKLTFLTVSKLKLQFGGIYHE